MRYFITFSYDGTAFNGYQKQPRVRTVQGELEKALKQINDNKEVSVSATGRTDAGVHALNQKAHFDLEKEFDIDKLKQGLNSLLPEDIYVKNMYVYYLKKNEEKALLFIDWAKQKLISFADRTQM